MTDSPDSETPVAPDPPAGPSFGHAPDQTPSVSSVGRPPRVSANDGVWGSPWVWFVVGTVFAAWMAISPWIRTWIAHPNEPMSVSVIYRHPKGDIQYFPLIAQLSRGTLTDTSVPETAGSTVHPFPLATMIPHAALFALIGAWAFPVGDVLVTVALYGLCFALARVLRIPTPVAVVFGLIMVVMQAFPFFGGAIVNLEFNQTYRAIEFPLIGTVSGFRIPRPFLTSVYLVLTLALSAAIVANKPRRPLALWAAWGASAAMLVQGDVHAAFMLALASPAVLILAARRDGVGVTLGRAILAAGVFAVLILPFVYQRAGIHPDLSARWGVFPIESATALRMTRQHWLRAVPAIVATGVVLLVVHKVLFARGPTPRPDRPHGADDLTDCEAFWAGPGFVRVTVYLMVVMGVAFWAEPLSMLLTGQTIQPFHFSDRAVRLCGLIGTAYTFVALVVFLSHQNEARPAIRPRSWQRTLALGAAVGLIGPGLWLILAGGPASYRGHLREFLYDHIPADFDTRTAFTDVAAYLDATFESDATVATFDHQLYAWWLTFHRGGSFLADPFVSTVPDDALENRLAQLAHDLGLTEPEFVTFLETEYVRAFWHGLGKYQASRWFSFAPHDAYTPAEQAQIALADSVWHSIIPDVERERLRRVYREVEPTDPTRGRADVLVLSQFGPEATWTPTPTRWTRVYTNDGYRVFKRREAP